MLDPEEQKTLLHMARETLRQYLQAGTTPHYEVKSPGLQAPCGAFVTLKQGGNLRGCIGHLRSEKELFRTIQEMAKAAGTEDPRFRPVKLAELAQVDIEISVLSPMIQVTDVSEIEVGRDGLYIVSDYRSGVLLPQVATEWGWDRDQFLQQVCRKAGLAPDAWKKGATLYRFSAEVFGENP
jgi:hypothetical protein